MSQSRMTAPARDMHAFRRFSPRAGSLGASSWLLKLVAIFLLAATVELLAGWLFLFRVDVSLLDFDEQEYWHLSSQILGGLPMEVGRRTMGYPLVIAGLRSIQDNIWFVQTCVALMAATAAPLLAMVVRKLTKSEIAGLLAGVAFALWPAQIFYGSSLYSETLALPLFLLFLWLLPVGRSATSGTPRWSEWVLAGLLLGITAHIRPMYQLFVPVLFLILWIDTRRLAAGAGRFALVIAGFAAVVLPWSFYVTRELHQPVLLSANGGETLAGGFNAELIRHGERPLALPKRSTWDGPGKWIPVGRTGYLTAEEQRLPYIDQDKLLRARTLAWMRGNPTDVLYLGFRKLTYMWGIYPFARNGWLQALLGNVPTLALALLFVFAVIARPDIRRNCARLYLLPLFVSGVALISWGSWRFRLPADAGMLGAVAVLLASRLQVYRPDCSSELETAPCTTL